MDRIVTERPAKNSGSVRPIATALWCHLCGRSRTSDLRSRRRTRASARRWHKAAKRSISDMRYWRLDGPSKTRSLA